MPLHGWMYVTHRMEGRPPTLQSPAEESGCQSASYTLRILKRQQNSPLLCHIKGKMTRGCWPHALSVWQSLLGPYVPSQGQIALCDLLKGNVMWQELLTSDEHLGVSGDIGHSYSFGLSPFVIIKVEILFVFDFSKNISPIKHSMMLWITAMSLNQENTMSKARYGKNMVPLFVPSRKYGTCHQNSDQFLFKKRKILKFL